MAGYYHPGTFVQKLIWVIVEDTFFVRKNFVRRQAKPNKDLVPAASISGPTIPITAVVEVLIP